MTRVATDRGTQSQCDAPLRPDIPAAERRDQAIQVFAGGALGVTRPRPAAEKWWLRPGSVTSAGPQAYRMEGC